MPVTNHVRIVALGSLFTPRRHRPSRLLALLPIHRRRQLPHRSGDRRGWRLTRGTLQLASNTNRRPQRRCQLPIPRLPQCLHDDHFSAFTRMGDRRSFVAPAGRDEFSAGRGESCGSGYCATRQPKRRGRFYISRRSGSNYDHFREQHGYIDPGAECDS